MPKIPKNKNRSQPSIFCNPDVCPNCIYIGEGDSICELTYDIVLSDWKPTDNFLMCLDEERTNNNA